MNNMLIALEITALGMGLVFAAIIVLWGMMNLLTFITADKETTPTQASPNLEAMQEKDRAQAAAIAVAIALAEQQAQHAARRQCGQASSARPLLDPPTAIVSAWQLGMRTRQLHQKGPFRRPRKIG